MLHISLKKWQNRMSEFIFTIYKPMVGIYNEFIN